MLTSEPGEKNHARAGRFHTPEPNIADSEIIIRFIMLHNCRSYFDRKRLSTGGVDVMNKWMRRSVCFLNARSTFFFFFFFLEQLMLNCQLPRSECGKVPPRSVLRHFTNTTP